MKKVPKKCHKCGKVKPISKFPFVRSPKTNSSWHTSPCKKCRSEKRRKREDGNPEKYKKLCHKANIEYRKRNLGKVRKARAIYKANVELKKEIRKKEKELGFNEGCIVQPTRLSDCENHLNPCPWIRCADHMIWFNPSTWESLKNKSSHYIANHINKMPVTCWHDYTKTDHTLEECGKLFGITRERIRQIQDKALNRIKHVKERRDMVADYFDHENRHPIDNAIYFSLTNE